MRGAQGHGGDALNARPDAEGELRSLVERYEGALQALRESEERFARAIAGTNDGIFDWNLVTDQMFMSDRAQEFFGIEPGTRLRPRAEWMSLTTIPAQDIERARLALVAHLRGETPAFYTEYRLPQGDGRPRWFRMRGVGQRNAQGRVCFMAGSLEDITERKAAAETLRESEARFRGLTELSSDWYWRQDENLRFSYMSAQASALGGFSAKSSIGKTRWELPGVKPLSCSWAEHQAVLAERKPFRDLELSRAMPGGSLGYFSISGAPIFDERGVFKGYQGIGRSITERRRIEEELRSAQRLEAMGTLAGGIAHDFNNILGAILGYGEMALRDAARGTRLRRDLDSIVAAGERGRALVDRVLAFSRSAVGERVAVHVERVVREALDLLAAQLPDNVPLQVELHAGRAAMLGDPTQVHQVVMNLATNGVQAMAGGGTLRVSLDLLRLDAERAAVTQTLPAGEFIVLSVADEGCGIPAGNLERIFDPFFTTKEVGVGTGLGLSLVHGIVSNVGGAVDVQTAPGKGSTFTVYLPRSGDAIDAREIEAPALPRGNRERVLIVDDEEPLVRLATDTLKELGYRPIGFTSSAAALQAFRANPKGFDAVITDERMPGTSGSELIREVRRARRKIPILLVSGYLGASVVSRAHNAGANEVLRKPLSARELATTLARVLGTGVP